MCGSGTSRAPWAPQRQTACWVKQADSLLVLKGGFLGFLSVSREAENKTDGVDGVALGRGGVLRFPVFVGWEADLWFCCAAVE